jgi:hypothetical protein
MGKGGRGSLESNRNKEKSNVIGTEGWVGDHKVKAGKGSDHLWPCTLCCFAIPKSKAKMFLSQ